MSRRYSREKGGWALGVPAAKPSLRQALGRVYTPSSLSQMSLPPSTMNALEGTTRLTLACQADLLQRSDERTVCGLPMPSG